MENLLYYPYINLPKTDWTARALLYYDRVGSIVPQEFFYEPDNFDPFMRDMVRNELVEPINPINVLTNPWEVSRPFIEYLGSQEFKLAKRQQAFQNGRYGRMHREKMDFKGSRIHADKFEDEIFYNLEQVGLAIRLDRNWFIVERKTARDLMEFLASVIGGKIRYQPTTDTIRRRYKVTEEKKKDYETYKKQNDKRERILNELIPFPEQIDIYKLRKFKDRHGGLLNGFKNKVETIVLNPLMNESSVLFKEAINELKARKEELSAKMNEDKLGKVFFGSVCGTIAGAAGLVAADTRVAIIGGLAGLTNAIYSALQIERAEDIFDQSGMKYLALVDKRLRIR